MNKIAALKIFAVFSITLMICCISGCKKIDIRSSTTDDVNIVGYLKKYPDSFSLFNQILERTGTSDFLDAYGAYTIFAPTNSGVTKWLASIGAANVESADAGLLKEIVKFHVLEDTLTTNSFKDGKLPVPTMQGQFLITGVLNDAGTSSYLVNRQAAILKSNIRVGNGFIHEIDNVMKPARLTIAKQLESNPDYSIFVQAMKETGFFDRLNTIDADTASRWKTVIAETNSALADSGILSYAQLRDKYSKAGGNPADPKDSLNLYVAYHIIEGIFFLGDIINTPAHLTLQPEEVIATSFKNQEVFINEQEFNGVVEPGVLLLRNNSDNAATNGVWHSANAHFVAKFRKPSAVYWDLARFSEILKQPTYYRKQNLDFNKSSQTDRPLQDIDWHYNGENYIRYWYNPTHTFSVYACYNDVLQIPLGSPSNNNRAQWVEFTTPPIIKGNYKVWICYLKRNAVTLNVRVNGELMQRPVNLGIRYPTANDEELESLGWKRYTATAGDFTGRMVGTIQIKTTGRHKIRFEATAGSNRECFLDMIHFIPVDDHQFLPRFATDGSKVFQ